MTVKQTKQDTKRQDKSPYIEAGQGNPIREKESKEEAKESDLHLLHFKAKIYSVKKYSLMPKSV